MQELAMSDLIKKNSHLEFVKLVEALGAEQRDALLNLEFEYDILDNYCYEQMITKPKEFLESLLAKCPSSYFTCFQPGQEIEIAEVVRFETIYRTYMTNHLLMRALDGLVEHSKMPADVKPCCSVK